MRTWSGEEAPLLGGHEGTVNLLDLVVHTGRERRFGGFGNTEWTVLHHSVFCCFLWLRLSKRLPDDPAILRHVLLHDMHEAYVGDIPAPVKAELDGLKDLESRIDDRIRQRLGYAAPTEEQRRLVKLVDKMALVAEAYLFGPPGAGEGVLKLDFDPQARINIVRSIRVVLPELKPTLERLGIEHALLAAVWTRSWDEDPE